MTPFFRVACKTPQLILGLALCMPLLDASAQIHRCKDEKGNTTISDRPCGAATVGLPPTPNTNDNASRIVAQEMVNTRYSDRAGQYDFIKETHGKSGSRGDR